MNSTFAPFKLKRIDERNCIYCADRAAQNFSKKRYNVTGPNNRYMREWRDLCEYDAVDSCEMKPHKKLEIE